MTEKINYYLLRTVVVLLFFYAVFIVFFNGPACLLYIYVPFSVLVLLAGFTGLFGSLLLFFSKKTGYWLTLLYLVLLITISLMAPHNWILFSISLLFLVYLISMIRRISPSEKGYVVSGDKSLKIIFAVLIVILFIYFLPYVRSVLIYEGIIL
jgi:hypothetical protein